MKKILSFIMAFALVFSLAMPCFASEVADVEFNVGSTYTVSIPNYINPVKSGETPNIYSVTASDVLIEENDELIVSVDYDGILTEENDVSLAYGLYETDNTAIMGKAIILDQSAGYPDSTIQTDFTAYLDDEVKYAGNYTDTVTFNCSVISNGLVNIVQKIDYYYSSLYLAVTDVNNNTIGQNADATPSDAIAGVHTDEDGNITCVLLQDSVEDYKIAPSVDMTINLGGNILSSNQGACIDLIKGNLTVDGSISGSAIIQTYAANVGRCIQVRTGSLTVNGGLYKITSSCTSNIAAIMTAANTTISDAYLEAESDCPKTYGIWSPNNTALTVEDTTIIAKGPYTFNEDNTGYAQLSIGINGNGTFDLKNCNVKGNHSGIQFNGSLFNVDGGVYEGYAHGGIYFAGTDGSSAYIKNASIKECEPFSDHEYAESNYAGMYIGMQSNLSVYIDSCEITSAKQQIVIRNGSGETNNSLYISNSNINTEGYIRMDGDTHRLYIGQNCNFTEEHIKTSTGVNASDLVEYTDEVYSYTN